MRELVLKACSHLSQQLYITVRLPCGAVCSFNGFTERLRQ